MPPDLAALAERIHTGLNDPESSRALIVFNSSGEEYSGVAIFHADMAWPVGVSLPPIVVREREGAVVASVLTAWQEGPDAKGRADHRQIAFDLRFGVQNVPAHGWRTYIASYEEVPTVSFPADVTGLAAGVIVVETQRHAGDLPPVGRFVSVFPA